MTILFKTRFSAAQNNFISGRINFGETRKLQSLNRLWHKLQLKQFIRSVVVSLECYRLVPLINSRESSSVTSESRLTVSEFGLFCGGGPINVFDDT